VTIGLLTFASFPVFVTLLEPLVSSEKLTLSALVQSLLTVVGIYLVVPLHQVNSADLHGALLGLFSAFSFAILTLLNRRFSSQHNGVTLAFFQNSYAAIAVFPLVVLFPAPLSATDIGLLILLGMVFTALAHSLFIMSLKTIKAQTASIVVSLEPIYGILAASVFLLEPITLTIICGTTLIIGVNVWALRGAKSTH
jgi:drug/metabolite transporter (DMT)-like permease